MKSSTKTSIMDTAHWESNLPPGAPFCAPGAPFYEWFSIKFSFYDSNFLLKLRMLESCRISSLFFGIYVKLLILKKLYFNLLITLGARSGQLIVPRSGHCPVQMPRSGHKKVPRPGYKTCPGVSKRCPDRGIKTSPGVLKRCPDRGIKKCRGSQKGAPIEAKIGAPTGA